MAQNLIEYRIATETDLDDLLAVELSTFDSDILSRRSFRHWINAPHGILMVAEDLSGILGYGLVWCHKGTRLARLYSLAVLESARGRGIGNGLLSRLEEKTAELGRLFMRLEVSRKNTAAISLYEKYGYRVFGQYNDYYEDHSDALRMQKVIQYIEINNAPYTTPWYQQTTDFTCGPASLLMAMASLNPKIVPEQMLELDIWRESTTIFMTSGQGGCHPIGLALAAKKRGFNATTYISSQQPLFIDGVRSEKKKRIMTVVDQQFVRQGKDNDINIVYKYITQQQIYNWLETGYAVIILISTYQLDGKKAPHWVTVAGMDERCLYVHDPDVDDVRQLPIDCQYLPIAREDFEQMSSFGSSRLRTAVAIKRD